MPSSAIREIDYDPERQRLMLTFVNGKSYIYDDVPPDVFEAFEAAPSKGAFFNHTIRDRYRFRETTPAG